MIEIQGLTTIRKLVRKWFTCVWRYMHQNISSSRHFVNWLFPFFPVYFCGTRIRAPLLGEQPSRNSTYHGTTWGCAGFVDHIGHQTAPKLHRDMGCMWKLICAQWRQQCTRYLWHAAGKQTSGTYYDIHVKLKTDPRTFKLESLRSQFNRGKCPGRG